jgi:hypothetical protein
MLGVAYGGQIHVVQSDTGNLIVVDTCCDGGRPPVNTLVGPRDAHPNLTKPPAAQPPQVHH